MHISFYFHTLHYLSTPHLITRRRTIRNHASPNLIKANPHFITTSIKTSMEVYLQYLWRCSSIWSIFLTLFIIVICCIYIFDLAYLYQNLMIMIIYLPYHVYSFFSCIRIIIINIFVIEE